MATDRNPQKLLIRGSQVYDHDGDVHKPPVADILIEGGNIVAVGLNLPATLVTC
jgi:5-methylthioadenosine/S-adenosylhomocysteine deaminase